MRATSRLTVVTAVVLAIGAVTLPTVAAASIDGAARIDGAASATAAASRIGNQTSTEEPPLPPQPQTVQYRITVISEWTSASHPGTLPPNSHFSPAVVAAHGDIGDLFVRGAIASPGIEQMAESGSTGTLRAELGGDASVSDVQVGRSIFGAGQNQFTVTLTQDTSLVSAVTMLAPSPDWFVGVRDVDLFADGVWADTVEVDLANYDAGTDSGASWQSPNADTAPAQVISGPRDQAFTDAVAEARFGRIVIERV